MDTQSFADPTRRDFVVQCGRAAAGVAVAGLLPGCTRSHEEQPSAERLGHVIGAGRFVAPDKTTFTLNQVDLDADQTELTWFELGFFGHGVVEHPLDPRRAMVFEKKGPGACEVDLVARKVSRTLSTKKSRHFYGHGAYSRDGQLLYCTESDLEDDYAGVVAVRDAKTMELLGEFPSFGQSPHDCVLIDDGKVMVITNAGGELGGDVRPSVVYVDVADQSLREKITFESPRVSAGHLAISSRGDLVCVGAPRDGVANKSAQPGQISMRPVGGTFKTMTEPSEITSRMRAETLSVAIHEPTKRVLATNPAGDIATLWDLESGTYLRHYDLPYPRGAAITLDRSAFALSYGRGRTDSSLVRIDPVSQELLQDTTLREVGIGGSHLFPYQASRVG